MSVTFDRKAARGLARRARTYGIVLDDQLAAHLDEAVDLLDAIDGVLQTEDKTHYQKLNAIRYLLKGLVPAPTQPVDA